MFLSYNNEGLMSENDIKTILLQYGKYNLFTTDYQRFKADNNRIHRANTTIEYLYVLEKQF